MTATNQVTATCADSAAMGKFVCNNQAQCWEPCGALGHSMEHARVVNDEGWGPGIRNANKTQAGAIEGDSYAKHAVNAEGVGFAVTAMKREGWDFISNGEGDSYAKPISKARNLGEGVGFAVTAMKRDGWDGISRDEGAGFARPVVVYRAHCRA